MFIRMLKDRSVSLNGYTPIELKKGDDYEVSDDIGTSLVASNSAKEIEADEAESVEDAGAKQKAQADAQAKADAEARAFKPQVQTTTKTSPEIKPPRRERRKPVRAATDPPADNTSSETSS